MVNSKNYDIIIETLDEVNVRIRAEKHVLFELADYFTYNVENFHYMKHRNKHLRDWDGKIRLFNTFDRKILRGLVSRVVEFAQRAGYSVKDESFEEPEEINEEWFRIMKKTLPFEIRDYQELSFREMIKRQRSLLVSPTASGKSLMIYLMMRWCLDNVGGRFLIVVPNVALVHQMEGDFLEYSKNSNWKASEHIQSIYSGQTKNFEKDVVITTWQSIYKLPKTHFKDVLSVVGDEAHLYKAKSLETIMKRLNHAKYRCGTTGTLDDLKIHRLVLEGIFGKSFKVTNTKDLMNKDFLSQLDIKLLRLKYPPEEAKKVSHLDYHKEVDHVISHTTRNEFITKLARTLNGNTLILFNYVDKHGRVLYDLLKKTTSKPVYFIHGGVDAKIRDDIRSLIEIKSDAIILASYGTFSTGINVKRIDNMILAGSIKSKIRTLQSIGRGLRLSKHKSKCNLYDICDDFIVNGKGNYLFNHSLERLQYYYNEGFKVITKSYKLQNGLISPIRT